MRFTAVAIKNHVFIPVLNTKYSELCSFLRSYIGRSCATLWLLVHSIWIQSCVCSSVTKQPFSYEYSLRFELFLYSRRYPCCLKQSQSYKLDWIDTTYMGNIRSFFIIRGLDFDFSLSFLVTFKKVLLVHKIWEFEPHLLTKRILMKKIVRLWCRLKRKSP